MVTHHKREAGRQVNASTERDRYSVAYFFDPNLDAVVACLRQFRADNPAKYPPVRFVDYFVARLDANYVHAGSAS